MLCFHPAAWLQRPYVHMATHVHHDGTIGTTSLTQSHARFSSQSRPSGLTIVEGADTAAVILDVARNGTPSSGAPSGEGDEPIMRDWKGDPLKLNPGDKLPGMKFL